MYAYENISPIKKISFVDVEKPIQWFMESEDQRSQNFHIHSWTMLEPLLKEYCQTKATDIFETIINIAIDWCEKFTTEQVNDETSCLAWYDMAVGLRAYKLSYILDTGRSNSIIDGKTDALLWKSVIEHQKYLSDDNNIVFHNNHGYFQVAGQLAMSRRFASISKDMKRSESQAYARLKKMIKQQFSSEYIHLEHSPSYHLMVYKTLLGIINSGLIHDSETIELANKIEESLSWFVFPSQKLVNFGDTDDSSASKKKGKVHDIDWSSEPMRFIASVGKKGKLPSTPVAYFQESGYFIVRKPPSPQLDKVFANYSYLAQTAAFHSRTHKHADDLSFVWSDLGCTILVDAGRYGYVGKTTTDSDLWRKGFWYSDPKRIYCESTRAHNTLEFDNLDYPRKGVKPYGSALSRWCQHESGVIAVETECRHFPGVNRARVLLFQPGEWLVVFDWFHDNNKKPHSVKQWFHLSPELQLTSNELGYTSSIPSSEKLLKIQSLLPEPTHSRTYIGETEPELQGWYSAKEKDFTPNYAFNFQISDQYTGVFATLFSFTNQLETNAQWSKVNISGRKGQFRWTDDSGTHTLKLSRPAEGDMHIDYETT